MTKKKAGASLSVIDIDPKAGQQSRELQQQAAALTITTADECREAGDFLGKVQRARRWAEGVFKKAKDPLNKALADVRAEEKATIEPMKRIEASVTRQIQDFRNAEEARRVEAALAEQRRREEAAREEQRWRAEELRQAAESASKRAAAQLRQQADIIERAQPIVDPVEMEEADDLLPDDMHDRTTYHAAVDDKNRLVLQCAAQAMIQSYGAPPTVRAWLEANFKPNTQASLRLVMPHMVEVNGMARNLKNDLQLEGVRAVKDTGLIARS